MVAAHLRARTPRALRFQHTQNLLPAELRRAVSRMRINMLGDAGLYRVNHFVVMTVSS